MIQSTIDIESILARKINMPEINAVVGWVEAHDQCDWLFNLARSRKGRVGTNALWCVTHLPESRGAWLQGLQNDLVDMLLAEKHTGRKRMLLQLLREQTYDPESIRTDFLDYCLQKINSETETYAIRCFSMYCAYEMCKFYPELIGELSRYLDMLDKQSLSPGLICALRNTRKRMRRGIQ